MSTTTKLEGPARCAACRKMLGEGDTVTEIRAGVRLCAECAKGAATAAKADGDSKAAKPKKGGDK